MTILNKYPFSQVIKKKTNVKNCNSKCGSNAAETCLKIGDSRLKTQHFEMASEKLVLPDQLWILLAPQGESEQENHCELLHKASLI